MKLKLTYRFALCFLLGVLAAGPLAAQNDDEEWMPQVTRNPKSAYMGYRVERGDTVYYDSIDPCWIFPRGYKARKGDLKKYYRLVYNFNKVYPYALLAKDMTKQVDDHITQNELRRMKKEAYIVQMQKELFDRIAEDYPEIRNKKELVKKIYASPYYNALQIRYAYCVTCHKAQGGQWKHVYLDTSGIGEDEERMADPTERQEYLRWLYTAVTRATEKIYLLR